jgi:hypothetical protein
MRAGYSIAGAIWIVLMVTSFTLMAPTRAAGIYIYRHTHKWSYFNYLFYYLYGGSKFFRCSIEFYFGGTEDCFQQYPRCLDAPCQKKCKDEFHSRLTGFRCTSLMHVALCSCAHTWQRGDADCGCWWHACAIYTVIQSNSRAEVG